MFSQGALSKPPVNARSPSSPKFIQAHDIMTRPPLVLRNLWPHISARPQLSDGRRGRAIGPSLAEPHLHSLDVPSRRLDEQLQRFTRWLCSRSSSPRCSPNEEAGLDSASLRDLRSMTDLALRTTKTTAQAIRHSTSSLIMLERHLWLTMTEMKEADKVSFLHTPVSSGSLFGPAVEGFAERFTEAQKSSQCRHFLPKRTCSSSASSRPRPAPTQQTAKPLPTSPEPRPPEGRRDRGRSRSVRRYPFPKRQGPRPKIALDPPQKSF